MRKKGSKLAFYHVYVTRQSRLALRAVTDSYSDARKYATALMQGRALPATARAKAGVAGLTAGYPVWTRYKAGSEAVMVTEHASEAAADRAYDDAIHDIVRLYARGTEATE